MRDSFGGGRSLEKKELISRQGSGSNLGRDPPLPCDTLSAPTLVVKSGLCPGMIPGIRPCLKFLFLRGGIVLLNNSRTKRCECFSSSHGLSSLFLKTRKYLYGNLFVRDIGERDIQSGSRLSNGCICRSKFSVIGFEYLLEGERERGYKGVCVCVVCVSEVRINGW